MILIDSDVQAKVIFFNFDQIRKGDIKIRLADGDLISLKSD